MKLTPRHALYFQRSNLLKACMMLAIYIYMIYVDCVQIVLHVSFSGDHDGPSCHCCYYYHYTSHCD